MKQIYAPFNKEQVAQLNAFQDSGITHPFTCGQQDMLDHKGSEAVLIATSSGWICPIPSCNYQQDWAHEMMVDKTIVESMKALRRVMNKNGLPADYKLLELKNGDQ